MPSKNTNFAESTQGAIAIIGMGCRFPGGASDPDRFWSLLSKGQNAVVDVPKSRWNSDKFYDPNAEKPGKMYVRRGGFLQEPIDQFDNQFFGVSPREASNYDPQQRLLLEVSWEAMENAGIDPDKLAGSDTGVYIGGFMLDNYMTQTNPFNYNHIGPHTATSFTMTILANRLSYVYDLRGPSFTLDTACSSSLVAVHQACRAIQNGECTLAMAGGVNVMHRPEPFIVMCKGQMLSADGCSKSFDERADGYGRGEGAGLVLLKSLAQAIEDKDPILSVIMATGINQDGHTQGITVPNPESQKALINQVCVDAGINPTQINFVEAHGTGTGLGDPLETTAIGQSVGLGRQDDPCIIGSLKSTVGHMEAAAGIASVIKSTLCLLNYEVPPQANLINPNPKIPFTELGLKLPRQAEPLPVTDGETYVGINSFGYGGTNAFAVLRNLSQSEQIQATRVAPPASTLQSDSPYLMLLSARDPQALAAQAKNIVTLMSAPDAPQLTDLLWSLAHTRAHHAYRITVSGYSSEALQRQLTTLLDPESVVLDNVKPVNADTTAKTVFVCSGMGPQWWKMGQELYKTEQVYRDWVKRCDEAFMTIAGWSIEQEMLKSEQDSIITQTNIAQPANFVLQVGIALIYQARGIVADAFVGHSVGEVSSAYLAGALTLHDALLISYHRSRIQKKAAGIGGMLAVGLSEADIQIYLAPFKHDVSIAAVNGLTAVTLAGASEGLAVIAEQLSEKGIFNRILQVEVAYHSPTMEPLYDEIIECLAPLNPTVPTKPLYSTVDGKLVQRVAYDNHYWYQNVRQQVNFKQAVNQIIDDGYHLFIEIGPHPVLSQNIKECLQAKDKNGFTLQSLNRKVGEQASLVDAMGQFYSAGGSIDFSLLYQQGQRVALPNYPWQREVLWNESEASVDHRLSSVIHPLLQYKVSQPNTVYGSRINANYHNYIYDHQLNHLVVMPGAGYIEMALAFLKHHLQGKVCIVEQLEFKNALMVDDSDEPNVRLSYDESSRQFQIHSSTDSKAGKWLLNAQGLISEVGATAKTPVERYVLENRCDTHVTAPDFYDMLAQRGQHYGPYFQCITDLKYNSKEVFAKIEIPADLETQAYTLHPTLLDSAFQSFLAVLTDNVYMPVKIERLNVIAKPQGPVWVHARVVDRDPYHARGDLHICDEQGNLLVDIQGLVCQALNSEKDNQNLAQLSYAMQWQLLQMSPDEVNIEPQNWLVLIDDNPLSHDLSHELCQLLEEQEGSTVLQVQGSAGVDEQQNLTAMVKKAAAKGCDHILYLWDLHNNEDPIGFDRSVHLLNLIKALADNASGMELTVITQGAQMVHPSQTYLSLSQASTIGLARVAANEFPELCLRLIDLDQGPVDHHQLLHVLFEPSGNDEMALRGKDVYVSRLQNAPQNLPGYQRRPAMAKDDIQLELERHLQGTKIDFRKVIQRKPDEGQIRVQVCALKLHLVDDDQQWFEGSAKVVELGGNVSVHQCGDIIVGYFKGTAASSLTVDSQHYLTVAKPENVSHQDMLKSFSSYVNCYYALDKLDNSKAVNRVLIHQADSKFGTAAVNAALQLGFEVVVTINDMSVCSRLKDQGVSQVFRADSQDFIEVLAEAINRDDQNLGFDLILNTLNGELRSKSFALLAPCAHFIEVNRPVGDDAVSIPLALLEKNISVSMLDNQSLISTPSNRYKAIQQQVAQLIASGQLDILQEHSYDLPELKAFSDNGFDTQVTRDIIVTLTDEQAPWVLPAKLEQPVKADGCYLVTGGLGGFGLATAHALVRHGATHLVLASRSGSASQEAQKGVAALEAQGCTVLPIAADISNEDSVIAMMAQIKQAQRDEKMPPLRGVIHSAAVLDDDHLVNLDAQRMHRVMMPKAKGAWLLHQHTQSQPLDFFVLYSSISSLIGNLKQGNYVAANTFLDHLAHYRQQRGLPATTVNWGAIGSVGMAARNEKTELFLEKMGIFSLAPKSALNHLFAVLKEQPVQIALMDVDWNKWALFQPNSNISSRFKHLVDEGSRQDHGENSRIGQILAMDSEDEQMASILSQFSEIISQTLGLPLERIQANASLISMGVDSLLSMEFQSKIKADIGVTISVLALLTSDSIVDIAAAILEAVNIEGVSETLITQLVTPYERPDGQAQLSYAQQRLWFIDQLQGDSIEYNMPAAFEVSGDFDVDIAERAINCIIGRHETLRTVFAIKDGSATQIINPTFDFSLTRHDLTHLEQGAQQSAVKALFGADNLKTFDLSQDLMIRVSYLQLVDAPAQDKKGIVLFNMHHIASDAWSIGVFLNEFVAHYQAILQGQDDALPPLAVQYADYAQWQREGLSAAKLDAQLSYWTAQLEDAPATHSLPLDFPRPMMKAHRGGVITSALSAPLSKELLQIAKDNELTPFMLLHGGLSLLLSRHSHQHDILIGTSMANRMQLELEPLIGFFVNTQVLRVNTQYDNVDDYLAHVRTVNLDAQAHQDIPFEQLVEHAKVPRSTQHGPLFQILFTTNNLDEDDLSLPGIEFSPLAGAEIIAKFDLEINFQLTDQGISFTWVYDTTLFTHDHVVTLSQHLNQLLAGIAQTPEARLVDLPMLSSEELHKLEHGLNETTAKYPQDQTLHQLFESQVAKAPDNIALVFEEAGFGTNQLSYQQLNQASNRLAHYLRAQGVGAQSLVGICVERSPKMIIGLLAILKAGGAYVPLDPSHPKARLDYIVEDTQLKHLLTQGALVSHLDLCDEVQVTQLDQAAIVLSEYPQTNLQLCETMTPSNLAYVIYTSGSTGKPKGVMVEQHALVNFLHGMEDRLTQQLSAPNKWLAVTTIAFDIAGLELFGPLSQGGQVVLASQDDCMDPLRISHLLEQHDVNGMQATPATWSLLVNSGWAGRESLVILSGGEALSVELAQQLLSRSHQLFNCYGPTEATIWSLVKAVTAADLTTGSILLGGGLGNYSHYVVDEHEQLVPAGCIGELCIGGAGLASGYFNQPELTEERFIHSPLANQADQLWYKTGDLVRYVADDQDGGAQLAFIGRIDSQVKIRGFRIELGEIETQLSLCEHVEGALVLAVEGATGDQRLVAYVVATLTDDDCSANLINEVKTRLLQTLPTYMVPSAFVVLAQFPLTPNGKIDKKALPAPDGSLLQGKYVAPQNDSEEMLAQVWAKLLNLEVDSISVTANFFELGGHSLLAVLLVAEIRQDMAIEVPIKALFEHSTIQALAVLVDSLLAMKFVNERQQSATVMSEGSL